MHFFIVEVVQVKLFRFLLTIYYRASERTFEKNIYTDFPVCMCAYLSHL